MTTVRVKLISEKGPPPDPEGDKMVAGIVRRFKVDKKYDKDGNYTPKG